MAILLKSEDNQNVILTMSVVNELFITFLFNFENIANENERFFQKTLN